MGTVTTAPEATTSTAVPRVVGEPLAPGVVPALGVGLFVVIVAAALWLRARMDPADRGRRI